MSIDKNDIKSVLEKMDVSSARLRNVKHGRGIDLTASPSEVEAETKSRAENYIETARLLGDHVHLHRAGLSDEELETIELVREALLDRAKENFVGLVR